MDLGDPWMILSGLIIGAIGLVLFNIGRKEANVKLLAAGAVLCIGPYFVGSLLVLWLGSAAVIGGLYIASKAA